MGNHGFMEYPRQNDPERQPGQRTGDWLELTTPLSPEQRHRQAGRCMDCGLPICQSGICFEGQRLGCPLHNLIPEWNALLWQEDLRGALARLLKTNPFPEFTGRVCPALCERGCNLNELSAPVTIRENERYIIEQAFAQGLMQPQQPQRSEERFAIVGSGPAGLSAAYWLNRSGHTVTVYERDPLPGGLLRYGIPEMKLPKAILDRRLRLMEAEGITFVTDTPVDAALLERLQAENDGVICCCGAQAPRPVAFEGNAENIYYALDYLRNPAAASMRGKRLLVIGAGDSASDCISVALRQGAAEILQLIRKPASCYSGVLDHAHEEALAALGRDIRRFETRLTAVRADDRGQLTAALLSDGSTVPADAILIASGFQGTDAGFTVSDGVYTAGDMAEGASLVVLAIASGKRAAAEAERRLFGTSSIF